MRESDRSDLIGFSEKTLGLELTERGLARIDRYLDLLETWNRRLRLTGDRSRDTLLRKHVADSLACVPLMPSGGSFLDVGTGGGFPGAVVACVRPDLQTTLLDARQRPISFLGEAIRAIPLERTRAVALRAEDAARDTTIARGQDVVTARALRMDVFLPLVKALLAPDGLAVSMQTPATSGAQAEAIACRQGLRVVELRDYRLPDGEPRRLVIVA